MKRFTQYLFECQDEKRIRNVGFVKADFERISGNIRIQARGVESGKGLSVFLFYPKQGGYESVFQGEIIPKSPILDHMLEFSKDDLGKASSTEELSGLQLLRRDGTCYMAVWNGEEVKVGEIVPKRDQEPEIAETEVEAQADETPDVVCEKIQRKELARLPRKEWYLANNNFLLHGFYNYHHLLWLEEGEDLFIGVPGVCHPRERQVAGAFGFTEFRTASETTGEDTDEEFGYFCRRIGRNK